MEGNIEKCAPVFGRWLLCVRVFPSPLVKMKLRVVLEHLTLAVSMRALGKQQPFMLSPCEAELARGVSLRVLLFVSAAPLLFVLVPVLVLN